MKTLTKKIKKNGYTYILISRGQKSCIYAQRVTETVTYYEVFLVRNRPRRVVKNKILEASEIFPSNESFGYSAWSFRTLNEASAKFRELERRGDK